MAVDRGLDPNGSAAVIITRLVSDDERLAFEDQRRIYYNIMEERVQHVRGTLIPVPEDGYCFFHATMLDIQSRSLPLYLYNARYPEGKRNRENGKNTSDVCTCVK